MSADKQVNSSENLWLPAGTHDIGVFASLTLLLPIDAAGPRKGLVAVTEIQAADGGNIDHALVTGIGTFDSLDIVRLESGGGGELPAGEMTAGAAPGAIVRRR